MATGFSFCEKILQAIPGPGCCSAKRSCACGDWRRRAELLALARKATRLDFAAQLTEQGRAWLQTRSAGASSSSISASPAFRRLPCPLMAQGISFPDPTQPSAHIRQANQFCLSVSYRSRQAIGSRHIPRPYPLGARSSMPLHQGHQPRAPTQWAHPDLYQQLITRLTLGNKDRPGPPDRSASASWLAGSPARKSRTPVCGIRARAELITSKNHRRGVQCCGQ